MKVTKFTYDKPNNDYGTIDFSMDGVLENKSDHDVEFVKTSVIMLNENDVAVGGSEGEDDRIFIASKDSGDVSLLNWQSVHKNKFGSGTGADCKAIVHMTTYRREFVKVGTLDIPSKEGDMSEIKKNISIGGVAELMGMSVLRMKDSDDGDAEFEMVSGIRNTSDSYIARAQTTLKLMDQRDAQLEDTYDYRELPAKSSMTFTPSFWGLKPGKIKNGTINVTASVFVPIDTYTAEATPKPSDD